MRRLLVLILCLLIPLQGFAAVPSVVVPCPMMSMDMDMDMDMDVDGIAGTMDDCCNDLATVERTGQSCKTGQACAAPVAWMPPLPSWAFQTRAGQQPTAPVWRGLLPAVTARLWRPPTSL